MKKHLLSLFIAILSCTLVKSQGFSFSITPQLCFNNSVPGSNTVSALVYSLHPSTTAYTWTAYNNSSNCTATASASGSGTSAVLQFPCCGVYTVICEALSSSMTPVAYTYNTMLW